MRESIVRALRRAACLALCAAAVVLPRPLAAQTAAQAAAGTVNGSVRVPSFLRGDRTEPDVVVTLTDAQGRARSTASDANGARSEERRGGKEWRHRGPAW